MNGTRKSETMGDLSQLQLKSPTSEVKHLASEDLTLNSSYQAILPESSRAQNPRAFNTIFGQRMSNSPLVGSSAKLPANQQFHSKPLFRNPGALMHPGEEVPDPTSGIGSSAISFTPGALLNHILEESPKASRICQVIRLDAEPFVAESPLEKFDRLVNQRFRALCKEKDEGSHKDIDLEQRESSAFKIIREPSKIRPVVKEYSPKRITIREVRNLICSPATKQSKPIEFDEYWKNYSEQRNKIVVPILKKEGRYSPDQARRIAQPAINARPKCLKLASREIMYLYDADC